MRCTKCGAENAENANFCRKCGAKVEHQPHDGEPPKPAYNYQNSHVTHETYVRPQNSKNNLLYIIIALLAVAVVACIITIFLLFAGNNASNDYETNIPAEEKQSESVKSKKLELPEKSQKTEENTPTDNGVVLNPSYTVYTDNEYSFVCPYPSHFLKKQGFDDDTLRLYLEAPTGTASMSINAVENFDGLSVDEVMEFAIKSFGGEVSYKASGDTWFALSMKKNDVYCYRKCFVDGNYIRYFDFRCSKAELDSGYTKYIEYIEKNFRRTDK